MTLLEAAHFGGAKRPVKERPLVHPLIDDCPMLKTITSRLHPPRPVVPYTTSNPVKSSATLHVLTSANLVPCPHQPLAAWAMIKEQFTLSVYPSFRGLGRWSIEMGLPPLNPGRPPERAGESTRTPLISPEWMIKIIGRPTRPCSGWPLPFTAHSPRGSAWCSTSRKAETMLGRSFSGKTARGPPGRMGGEPQAAGPPLHDMGSHALKGPRSV